MEKGQAKEERNGGREEGRKERKREEGKNEGGWERGKMGGQGGGNRKMKEGRGWVILVWRKEPEAQTG